MRFLSVSANSFLIEFSHLSETTNFFRYLKQQHHSAILDMIPAEKTIFIEYSAFLIEQKQLIEWIAKQQVKDIAPEMGEEVIIPVSYKGIDLAPVAELLGITVAEVIKRHTENEWKVAFIGFSPGFGYLNSENAPFGSVPRLSSPRKQITMGAVALAGEYSGIYPKNSPGGWQLIGRTDEKMWDIYRNPPALLLPGRRVIFKDNKNGSSIFVASSIKEIGAVEQKEGREAVLKILKSGMQTLIQDEGRHGQFALGVGVGGVMDKRAMQYANECVGNQIHSAVLEILNGGFQAEIQQHTVIAVTGAEAEVSIQYKDGHTVEASTYEAIALDVGDQIKIKTPRAGLRNYLAIRGGIDAPKILGSRSFDTLAELGAAPLKQGDNVYVEQSIVGAIPFNISFQKLSLPTSSNIVILDVILGPRLDWFDADSIRILSSQDWLVTSDINRIGLRLHGNEPLKRIKHEELPSEGTAIGALQIPPNGQPVLFMNDHPLTGGYPVIATVADYHLDLVAQIPTGCRIQFHPISEFMDVKI